MKIKSILLLFTFGILGLVIVPTIRIGKKILFPIRIHIKTILLKRKSCSKIMNLNLPY